MGRRGRGRGRGRGATRGRGRRKAIIESDEEEQVIESCETIDNLVDLPDEQQENNNQEESETPGRSINPDPDNAPRKTKTEANKDRKVKAEARHTFPENEIEEQQKKKIKLIVSEVVEELNQITRESSKVDNLEFSIDDISGLVAPTFSTISTGPPQPMLELKWDQKYVSLGERIPNPNVHMCEICKLPIRLYGRLIPCKHVFCYSCGVDNCERCPRCEDRVHRVEKNQLGTVFMCTHEGFRYGFNGCRRTYLSQRDLQAHINHRHRPRSNSLSSSNSTNTVTSKASADTSHKSGYKKPSFSSSSSTHSSRSNLISVPIQGGTRMRADTSSKYASSEKPSSTSSRYDYSSRSSGTERTRNNAKWGFGR